MSKLYDQNSQENPYDFIPTAQRANLYPVILKEGKGSYVKDTEGKTYLDFLSAATCLSFGYQDQELIEIYTKELKNLTLSCFPYTPHERGENTAKNFAAFSSIKKPISLLFGLSGSDSIEHAVKAAFFYTKKSQLLVFKGSYHGKGFLTQKLTCFKKSTYDSIVLPVTFPENEATFLTAMSECKNHLKTNNIAAFVMETIQADAGNKTPFNHALKKLTSLLKDHNILTIVDEVQTGCGRTGSLWSSDLYQIEADVQTIGKGLTGGMAPLSLCFGRKDVLSALPTCESVFSFMAHPASCAVALEVLRRVSQPSFLDEVKTKGAFIRRLIRNIQIKYEHCKILLKVDGIGLLQGLKVFLNGSNISRKVAHQCFKNGLLVGIFGEHADVIRLHPALNISLKNIKAAMNLLDRSIKDVLSNPQDHLLEWKGFTGLC